MIDDFQTAVGAAGPELVDRAELLPSILVRACLDVLPAAGAGLSVTDDLRVPLASSDDTAATAERLQTTLGEGPCLAATELDHPLGVELDEMAARWPMFTEKLVDLTPYRAVVSLPLLLPAPRRHRAGALDLYLTDSTVQLPPLDLLNEAVAEPIAALLFDAPPLTDRYGAPIPVWMGNQSATGRMNVWIAVGMLLGHAGLASSDALATLRAYAFSHDNTLDDVAAAMISHDLEPASVLSDTRTL